MIAACYSMDIYCDNKAAHPISHYMADFQGETWGECAKQARAAGWKIGRDKQSAFCPTCSGKRPKTQ